MRSYCVVKFVSVLESGSLLETDNSGPKDGFTVSVDVTIQWYGTV